MDSERADLENLTRELLASIPLLLEAWHIRAALMLMLSAIDILGALDSKSGRASRKSFLRWADTYLKSSSALHCTALDLFSARCGILHAMAAETDLTAVGTAAEVIWMSEPNTLPVPSSDPKVRIVHVAEL